jgi:uncharacterized protein (DUF427 family)
MNPCRALIFEPFLAAESEVNRFMCKAIWHGAILAESDDTLQLQGNHYFPQEAVNRQYLKPSNHASFCRAGATILFTFARLYLRRSRHGYSR